MNTKRLQWVDIFKGLLIILMVIGHSSNVLLIPWIYTFHMAAFFYISGYTTNYDKYTLIEYIKRKVKSLLVPFILINTGFMLLHFVLSMAGVYNIFYDGKYTFYGIINFFKYFWTTDLGGATWFLIVLFLASIFTKILYDFTNDGKDKSKRMLILTGCLYFLFNYLFYSNHESLQLFLDLIPMASFYICLGYYSANGFDKINKTNKRIFLSGTMLAYIVYASYIYDKIEWTTRTFQPVILSVCVTIGGIAIITLISKLIEKINVKAISSTLIYTGKNTISILAYHFLGFRVFYIILYLLNIGPKSQLKYLVPNYTGFIITLLTAIFAIIFSLVLNVVIQGTKKLIPMISDHIKRHPKLYSIVLIIMLTIMFNKWVLNKNNFFIFDDYNNLATIAFQKFSQFMTFLPTDVYCSRSGGWFIVKILLVLFGTNYRAHAIAMLAIHILNGLLLYNFVNRLLVKHPKKEVISLITALIFTLYPISTFASFWEAGMFDLFGFTLALLCLNIYTYIDKTDKHILKAVLSVLMMGLYYFSLRTKEMFICMPVGLVAMSFINLISDSENMKEFKKGIKPFIIKNIYLIVLCMIMFAYFGYTRVLNNVSSVTHDITDPYYYSFSPLGLIKNLYRYVYIYFNTNSLVYGNVVDIIKFSPQYKFSILLVIVIMVYITIYKAIKKDFTLLIAIILFLLFILPVLPMPNLQHVLYLYAPSAFIALAISLVGYEVLSLVFKDKTIILITVIVLFLTNHSQRVLDFRDYWINTASKDKKTYNYLLKIKKEYKNIKKVYVINVPDGYNSFTNGPGYIINSAFDDQKIKVYINEDDYNIKNAETLVIDFNDSDYKIITESSDVNEK